MFLLFCEDVSHLLPQNQEIDKKELLDKALEEQKKRKKEKKRKVEIKISSFNKIDPSFGPLQHQNLPDSKPIQNKPLEE